MSRVCTCNIATCGVDEVELCFVYTYLKSRVRIIVPEEKLSFFKGKKLGNQPQKKYTVKKCKQANSGLLGMLETC